MHLDLSHNKVGIEKLIVLKKIGDLTQIHVHADLVSEHWGLALMEGKIEK